MSNTPKIDELLVGIYTNNADDLEFEIEQAKDQLYQLLMEEVIGEMEYRETEDMALGSWTTDDIKAFARNNMRAEQQTRLNKLFNKE